MKLPNVTATGPGPGKLVPDSPAISSIDRRVESLTKEISKLHTEQSSRIEKEIADLNEKIEDLVSKIKLSPDTKLISELKDQQAKLRDKYSALETALVPVANINKVDNEMKILQDRIKDLETRPEYLSETIRGIKIEPEESIIVEFADGTKKEIKNTEGRVTAPAKLIREEMLKRAGLDKSLYGHLLKLQRKMTEGDKYVLVGEELPETFMNDVMAIDLAKNLNDIDIGIYQQGYFADRTSLDKLYKAEIRVAQAEKAAEPCPPHRITREPVATGVDRGDRAQLDGRGSRVALFLHGAQEGGRKAE
jgi:predicted  nucleic acid-binding Zn-ribbon protein